MTFLARVGVAKLLTGVAILLASLQAHAADVENVESLLRQGVELRHQGHDVRALPLFQKAYGMARTPRTAGQLGLCEMALGYWLDSENHLAEAVSSPDHPWVAKVLDELTGALATVRKNISEVTISGGPLGAEVSVNGQPSGRLPLTAPLRLGKGPADIQLSASGYIPGRRSLKIQGSTQETVNIVLQPTPSALSSGANPPATPPDAPPPPNTSGPGSPSNPKRITAWASGAVAVAALVFGVVETFAWISTKDRFENHLGPLVSRPDVTDKNCGASEPNAGGPGCLALHNDLLHARTLTLVGYGVAGSLAAVSTFLFVTSAPDQAKTDTAFRCAPDLAHRGLGCGFAF